MNTHIIIYHAIIVHEYNIEYPYIGKITDIYTQNNIDIANVTFNDNTNLIYIPVSLEHLTKI